MVEGESVVVGSRARSCGCRDMEEVVLRRLGVVEVVGSDRLRLVGMEGVYDGV